MFQFGNIGRSTQIAVTRQVFDDTLHSRYADKTLCRHITIDYLTALQFNDPAFPGPYDAFILPGRDDIPEQWIVDGKILGAMTELEFTGTKAADTPAREYVLFEYDQAIDQPLQGGAADQSGQTGADDRH